jgi:hypothetical protein
MFHEDVNNDYIEYFITDLYKNVVNLTDMENQTQEYDYTLEIIQEEIGMLDFLCRCRALTDAEDELVDMAMTELKQGFLINRKEAVKWRGNLKN